MSPCTSLPTSSNTAPLILPWSSGLHCHNFGLVDIRVEDSHNDGDESSVLSEIRLRRLRVQKLERFFGWYRSLDSGPDSSAKGLGKTTPIPTLIGKRLWLGLLHSMAPRCSRCS